MNQHYKISHCIKKLCRSFVYAFCGIIFCLKTQQNAVIHLIIALIVGIIAYSLKVSASDWRWLILCIALVWFAELINTAFEHVCDIIMPELHISVKRAKDIAAGAVLICSMSAAALGFLTLMPYL